MNTCTHLLPLRSRLRDYLGTSSWEDRRDILGRLAQAIEEWGPQGLDAVIEEATALGLSDCGIWRCDACGCVLVDPALSGVADAERTHMLGDYIICGDCYESDGGRAIRHQAVEDHRHWAHGYAADCGGGALHRYVDEAACAAHRAIDDEDEDE